MGGDEFAAMTTDKPHESNAMIQRLPEKVEARNAVNGNSYRLDFSVGSAVYDPAHPCDMEKLISEADQQMYAEKQKKKNNPRLI
jgi:diguanylate cyclase (GGDEF)-like protein